MVSKQFPCHCVKPGACPWFASITNEEQLAACQAERQCPPLVSPPPCVHLREILDQEEGIFACALYGRCTRSAGDLKLANCQDCADYLRHNSKDLQKKWVDPLHITDRTGQPTHALRNMLADGGAFLVAGGPSGKRLPLERLQERGIWSMAINNAAGAIRSNAFICADPPEKFHDGIWEDAAVMKFVPTPKLGKKRGKLREKLEDGSFRKTGRHTKQTPNTWAFLRRAWLVPDDSWFTSSGAPWGNHDAGVKRTGQPKTVGTILCAIRLLQYLGARRIFLIGADFWMEPRAEATENYLFSEDRDWEAVAKNNSQYAIMNRWLCQLRPVFEKFGYEVYNCNQHSHLEAFDYVPFDIALEEVRGMCPKEPYDLCGWYEK